MSSQSDKKQATLRSKLLKPNDKRWPAGFAPPTKGNNVAYMEDLMNHPGMTPELAQKYYPQYTNSRDDAPTAMSAQVVTPTDSLGEPLVKVPDELLDILEPVKSSAPVDKPTSKKIDAPAQRPVDAILAMLDNSPGAQSPGGILGGTSQTQNDSQALSQLLASLVSPK